MTPQQIAAQVSEHFNADTAGPKSLRASVEHVVTPLAQERDRLAAEVQSLSQRCGEMEKLITALEAPVRIMYADSHFMSLEWAEKHEHESLAQVIFNLRKHSQPALIALESFLNQRKAPPEPVGKRMCQVCKGRTVIPAGYSMSQYVCPNCEDTGWEPHD